MHFTVSIRNAITILRPNSERGDPDWWGEMATNQYERTRETMTGGGKLRGPS
jgi:hypothetical protein